ncbi:MAG: HAMP domain-containing histidine kinase, partial [Anaerolineae bacterium]|nr:HAMP domain-containing histidine kinase [Anaerolineae bacterium]
QAEQKGITLEFNAVPDLPPVRIYRPFLGDALGRLLDNAIKFSRNKGKVVHVAVTTQENKVEIAVSDEGVGIGSADLQRLFERFSQINRAKMEQQGIGVGLVITRDLMHAMGGEIDVRSELGVGSTFILRLPVASDDTAPFENNASFPNSAV